jgi:hypothetical protein
MLNVSFRRVRDKAFTTRDPELIAILGQVLVGAVQKQEDGAGNQTVTPLRIENVYSQLEEEYDVPDIADMILDLLHEQKLDPSGRTKLQCVHQENMSKHASDFWKGLASPLD